MDAGIQGFYDPVGVKFHKYYATVLIVIISSNQEAVKTDMAQTL